jgi:putative endonuclease
MPPARRFTPARDWKDDRHRLGLRGERLALAFLASCGWAIEAHRFRVGRHDVDLIVRRGNLVAFVEVKTRRSVVCGSGVEAVGRHKQRVLQRAAALWSLRRGRPGDIYRFDLVAVLDRPGSPVIEHMPDAWRPVSHPG